MSLKRYGEKWIDAEGTRTRYFEADVSGAANAEDWDRNFSPLVEKGYRCIAIDKLGQGYTDNPKAPADWTMAGQVRHVQSFLKALGAGPCHLVGHSRGGYVACRVTLDTPELVTSCVIIDSATGSPGLERNGIVFAEDPHPPGSRESAIYVYQNYSFGSEHITDEWVDLKYKIMQLDKSRAASKAMKEGLYENVFLPGLLADRKTMFSLLEREGLLRPTLLVWGFNDPTAPLAHGYALYDLLVRHQPRTQMHILNQAGHHSFREQAPEFNRVVHEFLTGVSYGA
jgi:2-hydroxy-6-oxonona-2,4-dienedioate hydrolase